MKEIKKNSNIDFVAINELIAENAEQILDYFNIEYSTYRDRVALPCPVHGSDNDESLTLYKTGSKYIGNFVCWTSHCEKQIGAGGVNLVQYLLSKKQETSLFEAGKWVSEFLKKDVSSISIEKHKRDFINTVAAFEISEEKKELLIPRTIVRNSLNYPCKYFIDRGYSNQILDKYDVGICLDFHKPMYNRAVVPVYNSDYMMIGCVGRTLYPKCPICNLYHQSHKICPQTKTEKSRARKWINSSGFNKSSYLYNLWFAKDKIQQTQSAILVEGQGDVWRAEEANIQISLGIFGSELNSKQVDLLSSLGVMNLYLALDDDDAGRTGRANIKKEYSKFFNIHDIVFQNKDFGEMQINELQQLVKGIKCN